MKIIDLGSSCFVSDHLSSYVQSRSYRAPEVILGAPYGQKIDVWSMGCILAELFSGLVLFQNDSLVTLLARVVGILGPVPPALLSRSRLAHKYFTKHGQLFEFDEARPSLLCHLHYPPSPPLRCTPRSPLDSRRPLGVLKNDKTSSLFSSEARRRYATVAAPPFPVPRV